jgi:hypothetical protein
LEFDLQFEFTPSDEDGGSGARTYFRPVFEQPVPSVADAANRE